MFLCLPVHFEIQWPPPPADIPPLVIPESDTYNIIWDSLSVTLKSIGSTGFIIVVILACVALIPYLFRILVFDNLNFSSGSHRVNRNHETDIGGSNFGSGDVAESRHFHRTIGKRDVNNYYKGRGRK